MAAYRGQQVSLHASALRYADLGYDVGLAKGKEYLDRFHTSDRTLPPECDGISIIPNGIVCIDYDCDFKDLGWRKDVPPTLKEKTPRGWHLFYKLPIRPYKEQWKAIVSWQHQVDLLVNDGRKRKYKDDEEPVNWARHILMSPTPGYRRIYPDEIPLKDKLTMAPDWLIQEITSEEYGGKKSSIKVGQILDDFFS